MTASIERSGPQRRKEEKHLSWQSIYAIRILVVLFCSMIHPLFYAPFSFWYLHWLGWVPLLWAFQAQQGQGRLFLGFLGGIISNGFIFFWLGKAISYHMDITGIGIGLAMLVVLTFLSLPWVVLAWIHPLLMNRYPKTWVVWLPAVAVCAESCLPQLFPYPQGASQYQVPQLFLLSSLLGVSGVTYLLFWANSTLFLGVHRLINRKTWPWIHCVALGLSIFAVLVYGSIRTAKFERTSLKAKVLRVGLVQANIKQQHQSKKQQRLRLYRAMSEEAARKGADWVLWPEGEFRNGFLSQYKTLQSLQEEARSLGVPLLVGGVAIASSIDGTYHNSAIHIDPIQGSGRRYDKIRLVPFAEYQPLKYYAGRLYRWMGSRSDLTPGSRLVVNRLHNIPYSFLVCYEAIFSGAARESVNQGARLLINLSNDQTLGRTAAPHQHMMLAAIRSAELGVPMVRATPTGFSTVINSLGVIEKRSHLFQAQVLVFPVRMVDLPSLYRFIGNSFTWLCTVSTFFVVGRVLFSKKRNSETNIFWNTS